MATPRWLTDPEDRAWRAYRRMQTVLPAALARDLATDSGLSDADYDVLSTLSEKPGHRWQLRELAARMLWSRSRLSHHIARMEDRELVERDGDPDDGRGSMIALTRHGMSVLEGAAVLHVESVRRHFVDLATPDELDVIGRVAERVVAHLSDLDPSAPSSGRLK